MITNFEHETEPLSKDELKLAEQFSMSFQKYVGPTNAITNKQIQLNYQNSRGKKISDTRIRKIINHIRVTGMVSGLVASSKGYYISRDPEELKRYIQSLDDRIMAISAVRNKTKHYLNLLTQKPDPKLF
jgi:hypothetical protein